MQTPLRVASWWTYPKILSTKDGVPGCWSSELKEPKEVQVATSGQWNGKTMGLLGKSSTDGNHAKIAHSLEGSISVFGDMNQDGSYTSADARCDASQNGRGGLFFAIDNPILHDGLKKLLKGGSAPYRGEPSPSPPSPTPPSPQPVDECGGSHVHSSTCRSKASSCTYVYAKNAAKCGVAAYGCYSTRSLSAECPDNESLVIL